jgi:hypothetical protein
MFERRLSILFDRLDRDVGKLDPVPHAAFPRRCYGGRRSRMGFSEQDLAQKMGGSQIGA